MRPQTFKIPNRLASYRELFETNFNNSKDLAKRVHQNESLVAMSIKKSKSKLTPTKNRVRLWIYWHEPNEHRSLDEVATADVFIVRAMVKTGILQSARQVDEIKNVVAISNAIEPYVMVGILEDD